jgi:hypothetical protein
MEKSNFKSNSNSKYLTIYGGRKIVKGEFTVGTFDQNKRYLHITRNVKRKKRMHGKII